MRNKVRKLGAIGKREIAQLRNGNQVRISGGKGSAVDDVRGGGLRLYRACVGAGAYGLCLSSHRGQYHCQQAVLEGFHRLRYFHCRMEEVNPETAYEMQDLRLRAPIPASRGQCDHPNLYVAASLIS